MQERAITEFGRRLSALSSGFLCHDFNHDQNDQDCDDVDNGSLVKMIIILSPHVWLDVDEDKETPSRDKGDHQHEF